MNERIEELRSQAYQYADRNTQDGDNNFARIQLAKFAELILQDCIKQLEQARSHFNTQPQYTDKQNKLVDEGFTWGVDSCLAKIKQHFKSYDEQTD